MRTHSYTMTCSPSAKSWFHIYYYYYYYFFAINILFKHVSGTNAIKHPAGTTSRLPADSGAGESLDVRSFLSQCNDLSCCRYFINVLRLIYQFLGWLSC